MTQQLIKIWYTTFLELSEVRALPSTFLVPLLYLFNGCWERGYAPIAWKSSTVVRINTCKGDSSNPASYHPIGLTSCIAKLFEKMIKLRFVAPY